MVSRRSRSVPRRTIHRHVHLTLKRILDILLTVLSCPIWLPGLAILALLVYLTDGRPILFRQLRPGLHGRPFYIYKFRTMTEDHDSNGQLLPDAMRLTRTGRFLRSTSLDELPELFNVLKGEMSLVGPRPLLMQYLERYTPRQMRRHEARPGITGWAQVNGRNAITWEEKFELDVWYVYNCSLRLDIKILVLTIQKVFKMENINQPGYATSKEFTSHTLTH
ncbi:MAG: sugar transferase [Syntrophobacteraceae bacterium]|nr:sugar transferase [Syntrophobacteraceae bacterium]